MNVALKTSTARRERAEEERQVPAPCVQSVHCSLFSAVQTLRERESIGCKCSALGAHASSPVHIENGWYCMKPEIKREGGRGGWKVGVGGQGQLPPV